MRKIFLPRIVTGTVFAVFMLFFFSTFSHAESVLCGFADNGFSGNETYLFAPEASTNEDGELSILELDLSGRSWSYSGNVESSRRRISKNIQSFTASLAADSDEQDIAGSTVLSLDYSDCDYRLDGYSTLGFGVSISGAGSHYPVRISMNTTRGTFVSELYVTSGEHDRSYSAVYIDVSEARGRILSFNIEFAYSESTMPESIVCTMPYLSDSANFGFANAKKFTTNRLSSEIGTVTLTSGKVTPSNDGKVYLNADFVSAVQPKAGSSAYFEFRLSGVDAGNLTLSVLYAGTSSEQRQYSKKISLTAPDGIYTIPIDVYGDLHSFALQFDNIECERSFYIDSIKVYSGASAPLSGNPDIGTVSAIRRSGDSVTFVGSMQRDSATNHSGESIYFYAIPGSTPDDISTAIEIGSIKVSTMFESTFDISAHKAVSDTFMFFAAVKAVDSDGSEIILPLSRPRYPEAAPMRDIELSNVGLYNAAAVGAFESNVSHVMVDVPLNTLMNGSDSSSDSITYISRTGSEASSTRIMLDSSLLAQLDKDIEFYSSAGIEVYLRITEFSAITGMAHDASADDQASVLFAYSAVIKFLAGRFDGIAGIALGNGVNSAELVGDDLFDNLAGYCATIAEICRITYNAASEYIPDILVIVPFVPNDGGEWVSERTLAVMLSDRLSDIGQIPWAFMYTFSSADDDLSAITSLERLLSDLEIEGAGAVMFFYQPTNDDLLADYFSYTQTVGGTAVEYKNYVASAFGEICDRCSAYRARAVFLSLDGISVRNDHSFYSDLKNAGQSDRFVYESSASHATEDGFTGQYTLWDFTDQYYPLDWIAGGGVSSCVTESSGRFVSDPKTEYVRVLRSTFETEDSSGVAGITMRNFKKRYDFSSIDAIDFTFAVESSAVEMSDSGVTVVFVIGTDDYRAEYYAGNVTCGEIQHLTCDLTGYEYRNTVDYVGIVVYADDEVTLDLSKVSVSSNSLDNDSLAAMFTDGDEDDGTIEDRLTTIAFIIIITVITVLALILLVRRDREEDELREAAVKAGAQNRRSRTSRSVSTDLRRNR